MSLMTVALNFLTSDHRFPPLVSRGFWATILLLARDVKEKEGERKGEGRRRKWGGGWMNEDSDLELEV